MIQRLLASLQALAAPVDVRLRRVPDFAVKADELAMDFDDAFMLVRDCPQLELSATQLDALIDVDTALAAMSDRNHPELRTEAALRESPKWQAVRARAQAALVALDAPMEDSGTSPVRREQRGA